ncbi:MAG: hypothetical protein L0Y71_13530 [Gemmataceae bacterium]|nr:hypothetical protein [Gemmataceae bacterium]
MRRNAAVQIVDCLSQSNLGAGADLGRKMKLDRERPTRHFERAQQKFLVQRFVTEVLDYEPAKMQGVFPRVPLGNVKGDRLFSSGQRASFLWARTHYSSFF